MTLLEVIQQVTGELGINSPAAVATSTDPQIKQLFALLNRHGKDLCRQFDWQRLDKEYILTTKAFSSSATLLKGSRIASVTSTSDVTSDFAITGSGLNYDTKVSSVDSPTQITMNQPAVTSGVFDVIFAQISYALPSDWKSQIPQTEWDRSNRWPLMGPESPQQWQSYQSGIVYAGLRERFRILANSILITPPPPDGLLFSYEYISNAWVIDQTGTSKQSISADTDTFVFDDSLLVAGLKMRWKQAKGLDFSFEAAEYSQLLSGIKAQDKSAPKLSLSPVFGSTLLGNGNIQDGSWGGGGGGVGPNNGILGQNGGYILAQQ